jgi:Protein of unknown function (DUF3375)
MTTKAPLAWEKECGVEHDDVQSLRRNSAAWKLLRADNAPLVLSFLGGVFVEENVRSISEVELIGRLDDELYALNEGDDPPRFPRASRAYLDEWASPEVGWLRKYYPVGSDEPHFDATPAVEKAVTWVRSLGSRSFVGTESRLNTIFELLRQMAFGAETDPDVRLAELKRRRRQVDDEIAHVIAGSVQVMDGSAQRDRYQQFTAMAGELLSDFREVETNFRDLDRELRERITGWGGSKGELLDEVVGSRSNIADSDQGKSFHAFYDFLLSQERQAEFTDLVERVQSLEALDGGDRRMRHIHYDWLDAGERTQATVRLLSEQLRRFLDDQVWLENRRVMDILRSIETNALLLREQRGLSLLTTVDGVAPTLALPMERPLYKPQVKMTLDSGSVESGPEDFDASILFEQVHVDAEVLAVGVRQALQGHSQVGLTSLIRDRPLEQGLAELMTYLSLADPQFCVVFDEDHQDLVTWRDGTGRERIAKVARVSFSRTGQPSGAQL